MGRAATELWLTLRGKFQALFGWSPKDVNYNLIQLVEQHPIWLFGAGPLRLWTCRFGEWLDMRSNPACDSERKKKCCLGGGNAATLKKGAFYRIIKSLNLARWMNFGMVWLRLGSTPRVEVDSKEYPTLWRALDCVKLRDGTHQSLKSSPFVLMFFIWDLSSG